MKKLSQLFAATISVVFFFFSPAIAFADHCQVNEQHTDIGCIPQDPAGFVSSFYRIGLGLIGGIAVILIIVGGYLIMTSSGDPVRLASGKSYIKYAIVGLLIAIFAFVITRTVAIDILRIPGFN